MRQYLVPFLVGVCLVACCLVFFQIGRAGGYQKGYDDALNLPHVLDTVWRTKLVTIEKPVPVVKWKEREKPVNVPAKVDSLVYVHDTTFMPLPREYKQYSEENYTAQVSGIDPALDWIKINQKTAYITNTVVQKKRWSFGVSAGPGIFWTTGAAADIAFGMGIVAGLQYNF